MQCIKNPAIPLKCETPVPVPSDRTPLDGNPHLGSVPAGSCAALEVVFLAWFKNKEAQILHTSTFFISFLSPL